MLDAQRLVYAMTDSGTAAFGPYTDHPQSALGALADLRALVGKILLHAPRQSLAERLLADLPINTDELNALLTPTDVGIQSLGMHTPKSAAMTAAGVVLAADILSRLDIQQAGTSARWIIQAERESRPSPGRSLLAPWGTGTTEVLRAVQLAAIGPQLQAVYQLRYRVQTFHPGTQPDHIPAQRLRSLPAALWPELALPLAPPELHDHRIMRPALSCLIGLVGNRQSIDVIAERLGQATTGFMSSRMLGHLREHQQWPDIQAALIHIADYLDTCPAPIDYERRRRLDYTLLLPDGQWFDIARQCDIVRSTGTLARLFRSYVFLRISGLPARMAPSTCTPENNSARSQHAIRYLRLTPELLGHLDHAAEGFLQRNRITDEPVTWYPPDDLLHDLSLPGHRPSEIDIMELHRLIRHEEMTATQAAARLHTTIDVVRCLLDRHPAPDTSERRAWPAPVSDPVREVLNSATFARLYIDQRMSLRAIGELYGVQADVIRGIADEYKIPIRTPKEYRHRQEITREWLHEQYVTRRRTLADIAEETGMTMSNVAKWARMHEIPLRPRGGASHDESLRIRERARQAPRLLRPALDGLAAEERLRRFVKASAYPTLGAAARDMGVNGPTLVTQINRLARELGGPLLERAERGRPMKFTPLGKRVVRAATSWLSEA
ncbi:LysR family transcriptional regulator [Streptomyces sp. NPDC002133]|uniref:LysR family transcriptional regulator n=1 Tax=Streptomyces sp. NPDC002133 TaxID=3154409 RepID=UPI00332526D9